MVGKLTVNIFLKDLEENLVLLLISEKHMLIFYSDEQKN
jgi:hypothetical protein